MFSRGAVLLSAIFLVAATPIPSPKPTDQRQPPISYQNSAPPHKSGKGQRTAAKPPGTTDSHPLYVEAKCERGCGYSEDNKTVLEKVRTDPIAMFTALLALFTLGLIYVGWKQASWIRRTVDDSNAQHIINNRAFVFLEDVDSRHSTVRQGAFDPHIENLVITPKWKNSGKTPTKNLTIRTNIRTIDGELPEGFDYPYDDPPVRTMIGPKANDWNESREILDEAANRAMSGRTNIYLWGRADYWDVFADTPARFTEFCYRATFHVTGRNDISIQFVPYGGRNRTEADSGNS